MRLETKAVQVTLGQWPVPDRSEPSLVHTASAVVLNVKTQDQDPVRICLLAPRQQICSVSMDIILDAYTGAPLVQQAECLQHGQPADQAGAAEFSLSGLDANLQVQPEAPACSLHLAGYLMEQGEDDEEGAPRPEIWRTCSSSLYADQLGATPRLTGLECSPAAAAQQRLSSSSHSMALLR